MPFNKENIIDFIKYIAWTQKMQIWPLNGLSSFEEAIWKADRYMCWGADKSLQARCKNSDIKQKKYIYIDIDIRKDHFIKYWKLLTQEALNDEITKVVAKITSAWYNDYCGLVLTGNWVHIYFAGTERHFDPKVYSDWVSYIIKELDKVIAEFWYTCDSACKNIARLSRMPWSLNMRKKESKECTFDLWPIECELLFFEPIDSMLFTNIELYATLYEDESQIEREEIRKVKTEIRQNYTPSENKRGQINDIPIWELAERIRGVDTGNDNGEIITLKEAKKNMWAYIYKPYNIVYNQGSTLIKTNRETFTPFEIVCFELLWWDTKATVQRFKDHYNIGDEKPKPVVPIVVKKNYIKQGFLYPDEIFDNSFDCVMSGELVTIVAESNTWKTTFAMDMMGRNIERGKKCLYINLEFGIDQVATNNWLFMNGKRKRNITDLDPLTAEEQKALNAYVEKYLSRFEHINRPWWIAPDELYEILINKSNEWYDFVVIDTFAMIDGNADDKAYINQNNCMKSLQEIAQKTGLLILQLHHTNKAWLMEWSKKILNLSNTMIMMKMVNDDYLDTKYTEATLTKDKFTKTNTINFVRKDRKRTLYTISD